MAEKTPDDFVKAAVGELVLKVAVLEAEVARLRALVPPEAPKKDESDAVPS